MLHMVGFSSQLLGGFPVMGLPQDPKLAGWFMENFRENMASRNGYWGFPAPMTWETPIEDDPY